MSDGDREIGDLIRENEALRRRIASFGVDGQRHKTGFDAAPDNSSAVQASEIRYRRLFEAAKDGILILDAETGKIVDVNPFLAELTGYPHEYFVGKRLWELGPFKDIAASKDSFATLQREEYVRYENLPLSTSEGRKIDVEFVSNVYLVDNQKVIQCNIRDITERRQSRDRDRLTRDVLEVLNRQGAATDLIRDILLLIKQGTDTEAVGIRLKEEDDFPYFETNGFPDHFVKMERTLCERDAEGNIVCDDAGNAVLECMCGNILKGRTDGKLPFFTDGGSFWTNGTTALLAATGEEELQSHTRNRCNREGFESVALVPLKVDNEVIGLLQLNDRRANRFTLEMILFFEGLGASIGIALARQRADKERIALEAQFLQSQKMEAVGRLAGGVAHDFNNLLSVILGYTGFAIEDAREGDPLRANLLEVKMASQRAAALTRQLLAFSRKQILQPKQLNLNQVVVGIEQMLRRILGEDIELNHKLSPDLGLTMADPGQIEQVIMNLAVNARDAMPKGGSLIIETADVLIDEAYAADHPSISAGPYIRLAIIDTGLGMDGHTKDRLFEPFFTTKEKGKGTGLGLSTVYGIVKQSGGSIWVDSEPGEGAAFHIVFPRAASDAPPDVAWTSASAPPAVRGNETILIVEDDELVRRVIARILTEAGYPVLTAGNGGEAVLMSKVHHEKIRLVLTDIIMPIMGGKVFSDWLAQVYPDIKVVYMSGYTDDAVGRHGVLAPGTHFIEKPFTPEDMTRKIREVLDESGTRTHHRTAPS
jgi:PAS domain S-box-containing protein